jgi:hypothetical protein
VSRLGNSYHNSSFSEGPGLTALRPVHHAVQGFAWHPKALVSSSMGREGTPRPLRRKKIVSFRQLLSRPRLPARIALTPGPGQNGSHSQSDRNLTVKKSKLFMPVISGTRHQHGGSYIPGHGKGVIFSLQAGFYFVGTGQVKFYFFPGEQRFS